MARIVAFLRGINVGKTLRIGMPALKASFERLGFDDVATYIASGNVVFSAPKATPTLARRITAALEKDFGAAIPVVLVDAKQLRAVVDGAPKGFGQKPDAYRYDVMFVLPPMTPEVALPQVPAKAGVDRVFAGPGALYYSRLVARVKETDIAKLGRTRVVASLTIRNWNTTTAMLKLAEERA